MDLSTLAPATRLALAIAGMIAVGVLVLAFGGVLIWYGIATALEALVVIAVITAAACAGAWLWRRHG